MKKKANKQFHTHNSQSGIGEFEGTAVKNKTAISKDVFGMSNTPKSKLKKPPKSLA